MDFINYLTLGFSCLSCLGVVAIVVYAVARHRD